MHGCAKLYVSGLVLVSKHPFAVRSRLNVPFVGRANHVVKAAKQLLVRLPQVRYFCCLRIDHGHRPGEVPGVHTRQHRLPVPSEPVRRRRGPADGIQPRWLVRP